MGSPDQVHPQILDALVQSRAAVDAGGGGASQSSQAVAQATAVAVQDAVDGLRNMTTIATTAVGAALADWMATGAAEPYETVIRHALSAQASMVENLEGVGSAVTKIVGEYPST